VPYLSHLLGVASIVLTYGGYEDQAIVGLLHDTVEDCGAEHEPVIGELFGDEVLRREGPPSR
jgi:(p)ppGpp synthase/HD superfamily hydrolase